MRIHDLKSLRASKVMELKALGTKDAESETGLDDDEATKFDTLKSEIDALDTRITRVEAAMKVDADTATDDSDDSEPDGKSYKPIIKSVKNYGRVESVRKTPVDKPGFKLARYVFTKMLMKEKNWTPEQGAEYADRRFGDTEVAKSLNATLTATQGPELIPQYFSEDWIELLRPNVALMDLNPEMRDISGGNLRIPRLNQSMTPYYVNELQPIPTSQEAFDQVVLSAKKLTGLVPMSNDLLRRSPINVEQIVRDDILQTMARRIDNVFTRSLGTNATNGALVPTGLLGWVQPANKITPTPVATYVAAGSNSPHLDQAVDTLAALELALHNANVNFTRPGLIMSYTTKAYLVSLRDGIGGFPFRAELDGGTLNGYPIKFTQQIPSNLVVGTGGTQTTHGSEIYMADFADVFVGNVMNLQIEMFAGGSYADGAGNQINTIQTDETLVRVIQEHDMVMRHNLSVAVAFVDSWVPGVRGA